jgi:hypothetical protein
MRSPVSGRALGECNTIRSPGFGHSGLTLSALSDLKCVFQGELDLAIVGRRVGDRGASRYVHRNQGSASRQTEIWMIEKIEELRPELDLLPFSDLEVFLQNQVEVHQVGASKISDTAIPKAMRGLLPRS